MEVAIIKILPEILLPLPPSSFNILYSLGLCLAGPGCSSVGVGAFSENGPFKPSGQKLFRNEYSWNRGTKTKIKKTVFEEKCDLVLLTEGKCDLEFFPVYIFQWQICCTWRHQQELGSHIQIMDPTIVVWMMK